MATLTPEQFKQKYGFSFGQSQTQPTQPEQSRFQETREDERQMFSNIKGRYTKAADDISKVEGGAISRRLQTFGLGARAASGSIQDLFFGVIKGALTQEQEEWLKGKVGEVATTVMSDPTVNSAIKSSINTFSKLDPVTQKNLEALFNVGMLGLDVTGAGVAGKTISQIPRMAKETAQIGIRGAKRVFDTTKSIPERIKNVRNAITPSGRKLDKITKQPEEGVGFMNNPTVSGTIDDIKEFIGLPGSAEAVDLTFRAIKPRITNKANLKRIKEQMSLANQTIVNNGFRPKNIRDYADAVYLTKQRVWSQIQSKLDKGQLADSNVDLAKIALKILDRASDPALSRVSPKAVKQLVEIAENLVKNGDTVDILTAERIKQLLNAELDDAFGTIDLSKSAKEAKKLITLEIGKQLDETLSTVPNEFKNLKIQYGSLSAIEDDILKRAIVFERQNPEGLVDMLTKTQAAVDIAFGGPKGRLKGIVRLTAARQVKKANNANELIRKAFERLLKE